MIFDYKAQSGDEQKKELSSGFDRIVLCVHCLMLKLYMILNLSDNAIALKL